MRILVVDDDDAIAFTVATILEYHGFQTVALTDATAVLRAVAEFDPRCVLLDLTMPARDGADVARELMALPGRPRVVIVSASSERIAELTAIGVDDFVVKPAEPRKLVALMQQFASAG